MLFTRAVHFPTFDSVCHECKNVFVIWASSHKKALMVILIKWLCFFFLDIHYFKNYLWNFEYFCIFWAVEVLWGQKQKKSVYAAASFAANATSWYQRNDMYNLLQLFCIWTLHVSHSDYLMLKEVVFFYIIFAQTLIAHNICLTHIWPSILIYANALG